MSKRDFENRTIKITKPAYNKIMSWAQALDEIAFLAVGKDFLIVDAFRLVNCSSAPRNYFDYSKSEMRNLREKINLAGLTVICMGHSHPHKQHLAYPSMADFNGLPRRSLQMIVLTTKSEITLWYFYLSYKKTLQSKIAITLS